MNCENSKTNTSTSIKNVQNSTLSANDAVDIMNTCDCGCGFKIGSLEFIRLHVESQEEQEQREALEQYNAEQEASKQMHEEQMQTQHPQMCNCPECN